MYKLPLTYILKTNLGGRLWFRMFDVSVGVVYVWDAKASAWRRCGKSGTIGGKSPRVRKNQFKSFCRQWWRACRSRKQLDTLSDIFFEVEHD